MDQFSITPATFREMALVFPERVGKTLASSISKADELLAQADTMARYAQRVQAAPEIVSAIQQAKLFIQSRQKDMELGDWAVKEWTGITVGRGKVVLPSYPSWQETKAPVLLTKDGLLVAPDLLVMPPPLFHDVKAKNDQSWYRKKDRWETGCDYFSILEYQKVQEATGIKVLIVVYEACCPVDPYHESELVECSQWLWLHLDVIARIGEERKDWPGGTKRPWDRGRQDMGGWLWPRNAMRKFNPTPVVPEGVTV